MNSTFLDHKGWFNPPEPPEGYEFGKERTREHIEYRIAWERWEEERINWQRPCLGYAAIAKMHENTRLAYQHYLDALNNR